MVKDILLYPIPHYMSLNDSTMNPSCPTRLKIVVEDILLCHPYHTMHTSCPIRLKIVVEDNLLCHPYHTMHTSCPIRLKIVVEDNLLCHPYHTMHPSCPIRLKIVVEDNLLCPTYPYMSLNDKIKDILLCRAFCFFFSSSDFISFSSSSWS